MQKGLYPPDWNEIAKRVKERAGWRCQICGHPHDPQNGYVLTVHHIDGNPSNCSDSNLIALCQRCHLRVQARRNKMEIIALDPGSGFVKVYTSMGACMLQSAVAIPTGPRLGQMAKSPPLTVKTERNTFYVGGDAPDWGMPIANLDFERLAGNPAMRALLYAAFALAGVEGDAKLIVSLPLGIASDPDVQQGVRSFLIGTHEWTLDGKPFVLRIFQVVMAKQPGGGAFRLLFR